MLWALCERGSRHTCSASKRGSRGLCTERSLPLMTIYYYTLSYSRHRNLLFLDLNRPEANLSVYPSACFRHRSIVKFAPHVLEHVPCNADITSKLRSLLAHEFTTLLLQKRNDIMISRVSAHCPSPEHLCCLSAPGTDL